MVHHHFLFVTYSAQGHINPTLQLAKRLIRMGVHVTLATSVYMHRRMNKTTAIRGLSFATFSDGYDDGFKPGGSSRDVNAAFELYILELRRRGSECLANLIATAGENGRPPFTCVVYTMLLPWAAEVARGHGLPTALLWTQPATVFDIYYYYFKDDSYIKSKINEDPSGLIELPGLPPLATRDLPSFLTSPPDVYAFMLPSFTEQLRVLQQEPNSTVLVNTFEELEPRALRAVDNNIINMVAIGPLIPSAFLDGKDPSDTAFGGDLFQAKSNDYMEWLDSKPESSVIYVSFGTLCVLPKRQMEEIARALLDSRRPFLWVIREQEKKDKEDEEEEEDELSGYREELEEKGKIVGWCRQVEVLSHGSVGCFVTHCGWNSSLESLVSGMPVVAVPQWTDQNTNAKLIEDVWKTGVRVKVNNVEEGGVLAEGEEIRRCLDAVMGSGEKGEEVRRNAKKWRESARKVVKEGGSSDVNLRAFVDKVGGGLLNS